jgi:hypothetical protein
MKLRVASLSATSKAASLLRFARTLLEPMLNPWLRLGFKAFQIGADAQNVMALRLLRLAAGGARAEAEASRMVGEKILAAGEAQVTAGCCHAGPQEARHRWQGAQHLQEAHSCQQTAAFWPIAEEGTYSTAAGSLLNGVNDHG